MKGSFGEIYTHREAIYRRYNPDAFVGREWLVNEITHFLNDGEAKHKILIGEPGSGKTAFLAYLAEKWNCPRHFMRFDSISGITGVSPRHFLISIGEQLHQKYGREIFGGQREGSTTVTVGIAKDKAQVVGRVIDTVYSLPFLQAVDQDVVVHAAYASGNSQVIGERINRLINVTEALSESDLLHVMIINPLKRIQELWPDETVVILVDALDESLQQPGVKIPDVIPSASDPDFPGNLRFIMTSRNHGDYLIRFQRDILNIDDVNRGFKEHNEEDVKLYIHTRLDQEPLKRITRRWNEKVKTDYIDSLSRRCERNFLYLYHFFNELNERVKNAETHLLQISIPRGLDEIYRDFAVAKIRAEFLSLIRFNLTEEVQDDVLVELRNMTGVKQVYVTGTEIVLELAKEVEDVGEVIGQLYQIAGTRKWNINNLKIPQGNDWERIYLPILGVLAVSYEALNRQQISVYARVEVIYVDRIINYLQQFLDQVDDKAGDRYRIFHLSFAEYLLDEKRNQDYPLDRTTYHYQIATTYRGDHNYWIDMDWGAVSDIYTHRYLIQHIHAAGRYMELPLLLLHYPWMEAKLRLTDIHAMLEDYALGLKPEADMPRNIASALHGMQAALRLSQDVLVRDKTQLAGQLLGRLLSYEQPEIMQLMEQIKNRKSDSLWMKPFSPCLQSPGGPLLSTLTGGHIGPLALSRDGKLLISACIDHSLKVLDAETWTELHSLRGHSGDVNAMALDEEGKQLISISSDHTLKVWDVERGVELRTLTGHTDAITAMVLSRDDKQLISASSDHTLKIWDVKSGMLVRTLTGHMDAVTALALSIDDKRLISASSDHTLKVWDLERGVELHTLEGHTKAITAMVLTQDGRRVISASGDCTLKIWDVPTGALVRTLDNHDREVRVLVLTHDGTQLISGSTAGEIAMWDVETGIELRTLKGHISCITSLSLTRNGKGLISTSRDLTLKVWDFETGTQLGLLEKLTADTPDRVFIGDEKSMVWSTEYRTNIVFIGDENSVIWASQYQTLMVWNMETAELRTLAEDTGVVTALALTKDSHQLISADKNRTLKVWDVERGIELHTLRGHNDPITAIASTKDGKQVISAYSDGTLIIWDVEKGTEIHTLGGHVGTTKAMVVSSDGKKVISGSSGPHLKVWDVKRGILLSTLKGYIADGTATAVVLTKDERQLISGYSSGIIKVWDLEARTLLRTLKTDYYSVDTLALTGDEQRLISADSDIRIWDLEEGTGLGALRGHISREHYAHMALTSDEKRLITAYSDYTLKVWDVERGIELHTLKGHTGPITALVLTKDNKRLISASWDKTLKVWDLETGTELCTLRGHTGFVTDLVLTPDGKQLISTSDHTLKVWNMEVEFPLRDTIGHTDAITAMVVTADGKRVITASEDHTLKVWDVETGTELHTLKGQNSVAKALAVSQNGQHLFAGYNNGILNVWDVEKGVELLTLIGHTDAITALALSPTEKQLFSASSDETFKMWDTETGTELHTFADQFIPITAIVATGDGKRVIAATGIHILKIWDVETGTELRTLTGYIDPDARIADDVNGMILTRDEKRLITADRVITIWDVETGKYTRPPFEGHDAFINAIAVTKDEKYIISASYDTTIKVWGWKGERVVPMYTLRGHTRSVNDVVLTEDEKLISASRDDTLKVWDIQSGNCLATFFLEGSATVCKYISENRTIVAGDEGGNVYFLHLEGPDSTLANQLGD